MTKLRFEYGLEVAFHVPGGNWPDRQRVAEETETLRSLCQPYTRGNPELYVKRNSQLNAEWRSPVMTDLEVISEFYKYVKHRSDLMGLTREGDGFSTGGGHLHLSGFQFIDEAAHKLKSAISQQPWIVWALNDPEDAFTFNNCKEFFGLSRGKTYGKNEKHYVIARRDHTVELRFFEAPRNVEEQLLHVKFADAWVSWVLDQPCMKPRKTFRPKQFTLEESMYHFDRLFAVLNLDYRERNLLYEIAARNLTERYATGELV